MLSGENAGRAEADLTSVGAHVGDADQWAFLAVGAGRAGALRFALRSGQGRLAPASGVAGDRGAGLRHAPGPGVVGEEAVVADLGEGPW